MIQNVTMLQFNISEGIDFNRSDKSKKCMVCHYWYFKDIGYKYERHVCNKWHDLLMVADDPKNFIILNIKCVDYRCCMFNMSKNDAINLLKHSWLYNETVS